jgi:hypothetical protein
VDRKRFNPSSLGKVDQRPVAWEMVLCGSVELSFEVDSEAALRRRFRITKDYARVVWFMEERFVSLVLL